jgi:leucyl-tRNA synthetase
MRREPPPWARALLAFPATGGLWNSLPFVSMTAQRKQFPFSEFEPAWQRRWDEEGAFRCANPGGEGFDASRPKVYVLDMFPYPSGEGLHVGHVEGYTATDIVARALRMRGFNVLHPMGWDAFGLPAEQYAIKTGRHPRETTNANIARFRTQLQALGFSYDWSREISTTHPQYFQWTQWIFLQLYGAWFNPQTRRAEPITTYPGDDPDAVRLAYVAEMPVNWCPGLGTVLANEEVVDGRSEVGGFPVERRPLRQWMLRITAYAERLLDGLEGLEWPEGVKLLQRNWIGRSEGAGVTFTLPETGHAIRVFTTRPDTLFGATYMVLAPEHPLVDAITTPAQRGQVDAYRRRVAAKSDLERTDLAREKSGVPTGAHAVNPVNGDKIPVWIADYVLMGYGTGAIMAVPAHDERDFEFAKTFGLPVRRVVRPPDAESGSGAAQDACFEGEGIAENSGFLDGLETDAAKDAVIGWIEERGAGCREVTYKLRDWLFSRQRYWGEPFPIVWEGGRHRALGEECLPVVQPEMDDFKPTGTAEPPLGRAREWVAYSGTARRETNTMPQWAGSCWYFLRFCDPRNTSRFVGAEAEAYWMGGGGVDLYVGGTEHAVLHLLYARFWHKVLHDLGHVSTPEPFRKLVNQGIILGPDGHKMSKSRGNVISPEEVIDRYGADSLRLYEMFMGPLEQMKPWSMKGVEGVHRFLARVWRLAMKEDSDGVWIPADDLEESAPTASQARVLHQTIKKVTEDLDAMAFNTAIAQLMICTNAFVNARPKPLPALRTLLTLLSPFAPHLCDELWHRLAAAAFPGFDGRASTQPWPAFDPALLEDREIELIVQVNGKLKDRIRAPKDAPEDTLLAAALQAPKVAEATAGKSIVKTILVPGKLINVVVRDP